MPTLKRGFAYFFLFCAVIVGSLAQNPHSPSADPKTEWKLSDSPIDSQVKEHILTCIVGLHVAGPGLPTVNSSKGEEEEAKAIASQSVVKLTRLDKRGRIGIGISTVAPWCGATGNCDVYLFDGVTGTLLVQSVGWEYWFGSKTHHGFFDFYVRDNLSAGAGTLYEYQFDGDKYEETNQKGEPPFASHSPL